jgi:hypothetical protein
MGVHLIRSALLATLLLGCGPAVEGDRAEETRAIMGRLLDSLETLLLVREDLAPEQRAEALAAAGALARDADDLAIHAQGMDETAVYVGSSLAREAREIEGSLQRDSMERARYLIRHVTENCVACHARSPAEDSPRAEAFVSSVAIAALPAHERVRLQLATRRFRPAADTLEALLLSPDEQPALLIDALTDYLVLSVRVLSDFDRPVPILLRFAERTDVWPQLRSEVLVWAESLPELKRRTPETPDLGYARDLIEEGEALTKLPGDRSGLVHDAVASAVLLRLVETAEGNELAETYYWLAVVASRIARAYRLSPADFFLERAIRLAPGAPLARDAYALLEREALLSYEGVDEGPPTHERARLAELKALVDRSRE